MPRANIEFLPIKDAWFSGSMNYLGRARRPDGSPEYEATYEINASLEISLPEFLQLVSHEVVPGHVTTFAYLQNLYWRRAAPARILIALIARLREALTVMETKRASLSMVSLSARAREYRPARASTCPALTMCMWKTC